MFWKLRGKITAENTGDSARQMQKSIVDSKTVWARFWRIPKVILLAGLPLSLAVIIPSWHIPAC
ncbi:hypothetical protein [Candidatus Villigracilis saccharophilus]|uniref:hypothetical protein n=1 Tax=Candidatus Villigracilis saccharophilus TaxID=3140684 RepID=UPI0031E7EF75